MRPIRRPVLPSFRRKSGFAHRRLCHLHRLRGPKRTIPRRTPANRAANRVRRIGLRLNRFGRSIGLRAVHGGAQEPCAEADVTGRLQLVPRQHPELNPRLASPSTVSGV